MIKLKDVLRVKMEIVKAKPPNIMAIDKVFPGLAAKCEFTPIFFCYGRTIYNPSATTIPLELIAHEAVHALQQEIGVDKWWEWYLASPEFRFEQELEAHQVEYEEYERRNNRAFRKRYLKGCAERLAGPLYGSLTTPLRAKKLILNYVRNEKQKAKEAALIAKATKEVYDVQPEPQ